MPLLGDSELIFVGLDQWWWVLPVILAGVGLILLLYRYEARLVSRPVRWLLLGLRGALLAVIALVLLQPVHRRTQTDERRGAVVVAVDLSESMSTLDPNADAAAKLRLARALGLVDEAELETLPGGWSRIEAWIADYEAGREPVLVEESEAVDPQRAGALLAERRQLLERVFARTDALSRRDVARRLLAGDTSETDEASADGAPSRGLPILAALGERHTVEVVAFSGDSAPADPAALGDLLLNPPANLRLQLTDLSGPLTRALGQGVLDAAPSGAVPQAPQATHDNPATSPTAAAALAVVLITDGRHNHGPDPDERVSQLAGLGVPVFSVVIGSAYQPRDVALARVEAPQTAYPGDNVVVGAELIATGFEGVPITVRMHREDEPTIEQVVVPRGGLERQRVEFEVETEGVEGRLPLVLEAQVQEGETRDDNNRREFALQVVDDRARVLLVDGGPSWEFRYLRNALRRDERVEVHGVVFDQPFLGLLDGPTYGTALPAADPGPRQPAPDDPEPRAGPFDDFDAVMLGDVDPDDLPEDVIQELERYVSERAGTLVIVAGRNHMPLSYQSETLARLLPVTELREYEMTEAIDRRSSPAERGFPLLLTPEGQERPMLQLDADPVENELVWSTLPGFFWGLLGTAKPGATVLAYAPTPGLAGLDAERQGAIIVQQPYGRGQVLWIGVNATWRWRHRVGDLYHHRFWGQLVRWAATAKLGVGNEFVRFGPLRAEFDEGEDVVLQARWLQDLAEIRPELRVEALVERYSAQGRVHVTTVPLHMVPEQPLLWEGRATGLEAGDYRVTLLVPELQERTQGLEAEFSVVRPVTPEIVELSTNRPLLERLAGATGGRVFTPDNADQLAAAITAATAVEPTVEETDLWSTWAVLLILVSLLAVEWAVRKLAGLP